MFRFTLLLLTIMPLAAFAQDEEPEFEPVTDRKYECHDRFADDAKPYVFVETFSIPLEDIIGEMPDDLSDEEVAQYHEELAVTRYAIVTISETDFAGIARQAGLDYRIDFVQSHESVGPETTAPYVLIIQADGDTAYYDFSYLESGETKEADRLMTCKRTQ